MTVPRGERLNRTMSAPLSDQRAAVTVSDGVGTTERRSANALPKESDGKFTLWAPP